MSVGTVTAAPVIHSPGVSDRDVGLSLELRRDLDWSPTDAAVLDALVTSRPQVGVFLTPAWLSGFFAEPPPGFEASLLVLRERGELRGIAPLAIRRTPTRVHVTLLGGGTGSDRVDLLAARGYEAAVSDRILEWLHESFGAKGFVLELRDVPGDSPLWGAIRRQGPQPTPELTLVPREVHALPYLDLDERPDRFVDDASLHYARMSAERQRRMLERRGALNIAVLQDADEVLSAFDDLHRWLHARWGTDSALDDVRNRRFHRRVLPLLLREGRLRMIRLAAGSRPIAVFYGLAAGSWWGYYLAGYDRDWAGRIHLGRITLASAIDLAREHGAAEFDFLKGAERIKYSWPVRERVTVDGDVYSGRPGAQLSRAARAVREVAAAVVKTARGLF